MKKKRQRLYLFISLLMIVLALCTGCNLFSNKKNDTARSNAIPTASTNGHSLNSYKQPDTTDKITVQTQFDLFTDSIFYDYVTCDSLTLHSTLAHPENFGITGYAPTLGNCNLSATKKECEKNTQYLSILTSYNKKYLSEDQKFTYDILKEYLELNTKSCDFPYFAEPLQSISGIQAVLPILFAEYNFYDYKDIEDYLALQPCVYKYFEEICQYEKDKSAAGYFMSDSSAEDILKQCKEFLADKQINYLIDTFNNKITHFDLKPEKIKELQQTNQENIETYIIPSYQLLIKTLTSLKGTGKNNGGLCQYKNGKTYYENLVKSSTGSYRPIKELDSWLDQTIKDSLSSILTISIQDEQSFNQANKVHYPLKDPDKILDYLQDAIKNDFPYLNHVHCTVKSVHKSMEDYLSPAFYMIPPIDSYSENSIYINKGSKQTMDNMFTSLAHEGYPGHLYQTCFFEQQNPSLIRTILNFGGYAEGWASYVEVYSYDLAKLNKNVACILKNNMISTLCLYGKVDIGIHYYGWTKEDTAKYLSTYGIEDNSTITELYQTILEEPANYLKYTIGYLEMANLYNTAKSKLGKEFNLKEYHEKLLTLGPAQYNILNNYIESWIDGKLADQSHNK